MSIQAVLVGLLWGILISGLAPGTTPPAQAVTDSSSPIDLVFVIDNSGSMRKNDPDFITPKVVNTFISRLPLESQVGMVLFDQGARLLKPLTAVGTDDAQKQFMTAIAKIDYRGQFTNSALGIERALYELKANGRINARKAIVFITDGIIDTGDIEKDQELNQWLKQDLTNESRALGVRIFGIAFSEAADFVLIQALAARTEGGYYRTYEASAISGVLDNILTHMVPIKPEVKPVPTPATAKVQVEATPPLVRQQTTEPAVQTTDAQSTQPMNNGGGIQFIFVVLALVVTGLAGVLVYFYIKQMNAIKDVTPYVAIPEVPPDAFLEDLDQVMGSGDSSLTIKKARVTIGRDHRNDIIIDQPTISSFHATIEYRNMIFYLEDQRSTNGTKLNGNKLQANMPIRLKSGDHIHFATFDFKFTIPNQIPVGETAMISMTELEGPESGSTVVVDLEAEDSNQGLINCMQSHLLQIYSMGPKYRDFAVQYFPYDVLAAVAAEAHANLKKTQQNDQQYCSFFIRNKAFYLSCSLPVSIRQAAQWFGNNHNGFTQFVMQWIKSEDYSSSECENMFVVTFGQDPSTWVSLTIVPTHEDENPVEIMSVDFLNEAEKAMLALDFDSHGRVA